MRTSLLLLGVLVPASALAAPFLGTSSFRDVPDNSPYVEAIEYARDHDIVQGYDDGTFRPDALLNRAEFTKIVVATVEDATDITECMRNAQPDFFYSSPFLFADTPVKAWYLPYLCQAKLQHIIDGYPDGTFRAARFINLAEAAKILSHSFALPETPATDENIPWYVPSIDALAAAHALPTDLENVDSVITRGQMVEMIYRLHAHITDKPSATYESLTE